MQTRLKEQLLELGQHTSAMQLSETELAAKVDRNIAHTFLWMGSVLLLAFTIGYGTATGILPLPISMPLMRVSWIGGFVLILVMSRRWQRMNYQTLACLFILFSLLEGYGLTGIFITYTGASILQVFLLSAGMFLALAVAGYYLHVDITKVRPILFTGLIVLIIALVINAFWQNSTFDIWLSVLGLILFAGMILYDMNVLKQQALVDDRRIAILMALGLFINFINIFLFLLRLFGSRN